MLHSQAVPAAPGSATTPHVQEPQSLPFVQAHTAGDDPRDGESQGWAGASTAASHKLWLMPDMELEQLWKHGELKGLKKSVPCCSEMSCVSVAVPVLLNTHPLSVAG